MLTKLRRVLITARISKGSAAHPTPEQTKAVLAAWPPPPITARAEFVMIDVSRWRDSDQQV
jgi:hypothetical protein